MNLQRRCLLGTAAALLGAPVLSASAQGAASWPNKPVRIIVPNVPGGASDLVTRAIQGDLQKLWNQQILVEYKAGAGTVLGTDYVAKSAPDGYTLGLVVTSHVINPGLRKVMPFDTLKDLAHVCQVSTSNLLLSASPKFAPATLKEVIAVAKARPGALSYATAGAGSSMHLAGELLKQMTDTFMLHIPYKGTGGGAYSDVFDGRVDLIIDPIPSSMVHVNSGRLKPIAVLGARRDPTMPNIPAAGELLPGFDARSINGIVAPAATPRELVQKISGDFGKVLRTETLRSRFRELGLEATPSSPQEFETFVRAEIKRWDAVIKRANITLD
jgi:tripartite-type tricarboxylate transporter receptor subunit TctC